MSFEESGEPLFIDAAAVILAHERIRMGSHVRIDAGALLSPADGTIALGSRVHISAGARLYGGGSIEIDDLACVSAGATILSVTDDFRGPYLCGPMVPDSSRNVIEAPVRCARSAVVGAGSVVLPGVTIGMGAAVGALSLVNADVPAGAIVAGAPARQIGNRDLEQLERRAASVLD